MSGEGHASRPQVCPVRVFLHSDCILFDFIQTRLKSDSFRLPRCGNVPVSEVSIALAAHRARQTVLQGRRAYFFPLGVRWLCDYFTAPFNN